MAYELQALQYAQPLVKDCQFGVSPVNYSDSDSDEHYQDAFGTLDVNKWTYEVAAECK